MKKLLFAILFLLSVTVFGQKVKIIEGSLASLKGESSVKLEFVYEPMTIGGEGLAEDDYIARKKEEYNKKEEGRGEKWEKAWKEDRKNRFEPKFKDLFEKYAKRTHKKESKYTLIFHTTRTEPGFNVAVMRRPARIDGIVTIVETANPKNIIAKIAVDNAPGRDAWGFDYDTGLRIQEAYAASGRAVGKLIASKAK